MFGLPGQEPDDAKPSDYTGDYWLYCGCCSAYVEGKWMLFYHVSRIDEAWDRAKSKYRIGLLQGVEAMKVSTALPNPNARDSHIKVLIFYCGSESDEPGTLAVGRTILQQMQYTGPGCASRYKNIFWKSDRATLQGIYSGRGQQRASTFSLPIPQPQYAAAAAAAAAPAPVEAAVSQPQQAAHTPLTDAQQRRQALAAAAEQRQQAAAAAEAKRHLEAAGPSSGTGGHQEVEVIDLT